MSNEMQDPDNIINAYLRGRLSDADAAALEQTLVTEPDRWRDFERVLRTNAGLAHLRERGELTPMPAVATWYRRAPTLAAAAALASVAVGAKWLIELTAGGRAPALSAARGNHSGLAAQLLLARTRGDAPTIGRPANGLLDIRVRPEYLGHDRYDLQLTVPSVDGEPPKTLALREVALDNDGHIAVFLTGKNLPLGEYRVRIAPANGNSAEMSEFEFHVVGDATMH